MGGHSLGANGALAYASSGRPVLGIFALSPGHVPERAVFRKVAAPGVERARELLAGGKPQDKAWFPDLNQGRSRNIRTTAAAYLSYFDPDGAASMPKSAAALPTPVPIFMAVGDADSIAGYAETAIYQAAARHDNSVYLAQPGDHFSTVSIVTPALIRWLDALSR